MPAFQKIVRFHLAVSDMDTARDFYTDKLGFTLAQERSQGGERWAFLALPDDTVSVLLTTERQFMKPGTMKLYLSAPDIDAAYEELTAKGLELTGGVRHDQWATWFDFHDPEGNHLIVTG